MARNKNKTTPKVIEAKERAAKALELRKEGRTFVEIAQEAGYNSPQAAHDAVKRAINEIIREPVEDVLRIELERLDALFGIQYLNAQAGDVQALGAAIKIMERRARYLGLDAAPKPAVTDEAETPAIGRIEIKVVGGESNNPNDADAATG